MNCTSTLYYNYSEYVYWYQIECNNKITISTNLLYPAKIFGNC